MRLAFSKTRKREECYASSDVAGKMHQSLDVFSRWVGMTLPSDSKTQLWITLGLALGFHVLIAALKIKFV
jgi:dTDP-4-dehydrorhamnose 3,5-epimerase-like enzyme